MNCRRIGAGFDGSFEPNFWNNKQIDVEFGG